MTTTLSRFVDRRTLLITAAAMAADVDPVLLMLPAALTASCAFMLPTATTPNTVAFSAGHFSIRKMASEGGMLNLFGVVVITGICFLLLSS